MKRTTAFAVCLLANVSALHAQDTSKNTPSVPFAYTVEAAPEWTRLFERTEGWFGADGIFSIPLTGVDKNNNEGNDSTLLLFGDTYFGKVKDGRPLPGNTMVNNSIAYITGNEPDTSNIHFYCKKSTSGSPESFFIPKASATSHPQLFWLGDGFVNQEKNNTLYIFAYKIERTGSGVFDFTEPGVSLLAIPDARKPPFNNYRQLESPLHIKNVKAGEGNMGAGVFVNTAWAGAPNPDGYLYVYGCVGADKNLVVARVKPSDIEDFGQWRYWDGSTWSPHAEDLAPVTNAVSNELSLTPLKNGKYLLVFQVTGLSDKVGIRIGDTPVGPFSPITEIWSAPEWKQGLWTYNAKAHPNLSKPGELLISYNTITADFWNDIQKDASIYHPRFIRLKFTGN